MLVQRIQELSARSEVDCVWSAPSHPEDMKAADWQRLDSALGRAREKLLETGELDVRDGSDDTEKG